MNRENFLEAVKHQYAEKINEAYLQCEHEKGAFDHAKFNMLIQKLRKAAAAEGLPAHEFDDVLKSALPSFKGDIAA